MARRLLARRLAVAVAVVSALQIANNLLPYLGWRDDSCQTMFSGLRWSARSNNHLFVPQRSVGDLWVFYVDLSAAVAPPARGGREEAIVEWLELEGVQHNAEAVRVAVRQLCDAGHTVRLSYRVRHEGRTVEDADACREPALSQPHGWIPVRLYDSHYPWGGEE